MNFWVGTKYALEQGFQLCSSPTDGHFNSAITVIYSILVLYPCSFEVFYKCYEPHFVLKTSASDRLVDTKVEVVQKIESAKILHIIYMSGQYEL